MTYRWNITEHAAGYDAAAEIIHPYYLAIQDEILRHLPLADNAPSLVIDLGGGSGRLVERILDRWPQTHGVVVDQSEAFLGIAERRLNRFGERATCVHSRLQDQWLSQLPVPVTAIVSMSAIHHLDPAEKQSLYRRCCELLAPRGVLLNGDEVRAADDATYLAALEKWAGQMRQNMDSGAIPASFHNAPLGWMDRNIMRFGQPKHSGDDCHETIDTQLGYFRAVGFATADCPWQHEMWAVLRGIK